MKDIQRTPELKKAFEESIKHWRENQELPKAKAQIYGDSCPMCLLVGAICEKCPLGNDNADSQGRACCFGLWTKASYTESNSAFSSAAKAVADFIEQTMNEYFPVEREKTMGKIMEVSAEIDSGGKVLGVNVDGVRFVPAPDEPVKPKIIAWDVNCDSKRTDIVIPTQGGLRSFCLSGDCGNSQFGICNGSVVLGLNDDAHKMFNLKDLVSTMQEAMKVDRINAITSQVSNEHIQAWISAGNKGNIAISWSCSYKDIILSKPDTAKLAMGLLGLAVEK